MAVTDGMISTAQAVTSAPWEALDLGQACELTAAIVYERAGSSPAGLSDAEANVRLALVGRNALRRYSANAIRVLTRQFDNPLLILLGATAAASLAFGERTDAVIILAIVLLSVGLGFVNEYRSERAIEDLHARVRHSAMVVRNGQAKSVDVTTLVPGDVVLMGIGDVVPADVRLVESHEFECDEAILTGESMPAEKTVAPRMEPGSSGAADNCAFMGTVVRGGTARAIVIRTGPATELGRISHHLVQRPPLTAFSLGLRNFSKLLVRITAVFTAIVFAVNIALHHPLFESLLFALAIAVAITPQLLPAIVTICLSIGAKRMAEGSVIVKRLLSIEDLGNIEVLFTDKTGTITEGEIRLAGALDSSGAPSIDVLRLGLLCNGAIVESGAPVGGNALDMAIWLDPLAQKVGTGEMKVIAQAPFDFVRRRMSVLVEDGEGRRSIIVKGAPEAVLACCSTVPDSLHQVLDERLAAGERVLAVASRDAPGLTTLTVAEERSLQAQGLLAFFDPPKQSAEKSLAQLQALGITLKIVTGDNERVAQKVCSSLNIAVTGTLTGAQLDGMDDAALGAALATTNIFARVSPEQKSRIIRVQRSLGVDVGFLGDGVNDAVALHDADVGISVDSGADVAKDAADIVLLDKDLGILADGVSQGRRVFANTIKYILMGTSSNFGNMISTGTASLFLPFLPMLPSQLLLNNLLYDASEMTIPTDNVDPELLQRPAHWDMDLIRRFLFVFGSINSLFDFTIFGVMLFVFHANQTLFRSGFFVENFLTQTLVVFAIRTRRVPFFRSRPSLPLTLTTLIVGAAGTMLPFTPLARLFGFEPLPRLFFGVLMLIIMTAYFTLVEVAKVFFFRSIARRARPPRTGTSLMQRLERIIARFRHTQASRLSPGGAPPEGT
jgi:P-type Mg2+ transporter